MEALRRLQAHLDSLRRAGGAPVPPFPRPLSPFTAPPPVPDPLIDWLLEDLPARDSHDLAEEAAAAQRLKGYRPGHLPRPEGLKLLKRRYEKEPAFRARLGALWLKGRKKEETAFRLLKAEDIRRDPWALVERFGFPASVWLLLLSNGGVLRAVAVQMLKEVTAQAGKLEEVMARRPAPGKLWSLPEIPHDQEIDRVRAEIEQVLAERDRWKEEAAAEKSKRERAESALAQAQAEVQKLGPARHAAEEARRAAEARAAELEAHLDKLRGGEAALKRLEKQLRELQHEKTALAAERDELRSSLEALERERTDLRRTLDESGRTLRFLQALLAPGDGPAASYKGETLLVVTAAPPAPFFEAAKGAGLTLLIHDGRSLPALDRPLEQAWRVILWGDPADFPGGLLEKLRASRKPFAVLPELAPSLFPAFLRRAAPLLRRLA